jgi:hypothetical protein
MPAHRPIEVDALSPTFHEAYRRAGGTPERPDAGAAWAAFRELAVRPVVAGDAAPEVDEDFFVVEISAGGEYRPEFMIERRVGLADEKHDHLETVLFTLALHYEEQPAIAALTTGAVHASFRPERDSAEVAVFLDEIERTDRFRVFFRDCVPVGMYVSPPPERDLPAGYP